MLGGGPLMKHFCKTFVKTSAMTAINLKLRGLVTNDMLGEGSLIKHFCKTFVKTSAMTVINFNFHFSHCKSMESLSYHSNQSARVIRKQILVEAIVRNNSAKFQLYPPNSFWGVDFWIFFHKFCFLVAMVMNQIKRLEEKVSFVQDHLRNITVKFLSKYL